MRPPPGLQKGLAHHLRGVGDGNQIDFFVQCADQNGLPEAIDGPFGLSVPTQPLQERFAGVVRSNGSKGGQTGCNRKLVGKIQAEARRKDGAVCSGAGRDEGSMTEARPPGSRNVIRSYQRILSSTPMRW